MSPAVTEVEGGILRARSEGACTVGWIRTDILRPPQARGGHVQALDGLRGLAVLIVIASHLSNAGWLPQPGLVGIGKSGVYLFFVLSAYLLSHAILARSPLDLRRAGYWMNYALRRVLRIWPLYLLVLLVSWVLTRLGVTAWHYQLDTAALWRHLALREGQSVLWSIPVEFTFYLWLPGICLALAWLRGRPGGRWWGLGLLLALGFWASWRWPASAAPTNSIQLGYYLVVFLSGVGAAWLAQQWPGLRRHARAWRVLGWALLVALALATPGLWVALGAKFNPEMNHRWFAAFGAGWALLLLSVLWGGGLVSRLFSSTPLRLMGMVSFSAYLWHMPVLQGLDALGIRDWGAWCLPLLLGAMLTAAVVSFLLFERPWRDVRIWQG